MSNARNLVEQNGYCPVCEELFFTSVNSPTLNVVHQPKIDKFVYFIQCPRCGHVGPEEISFITALMSFNNCEEM